MTEDQRVLYDNVGEVRNADAAMRWSVAQVFLVIHSGLFTVFMTRLAEEILTKIILSFVGVLLGLLWMLITDRTQELLMYWNNRLRLLEQFGEQVVYVFGGPEYRALQERIFITYTILLILIYVISVVWLGIFLWFVSAIKI